MENKKNPKNKSDPSSATDGADDYLKNFVVPPKCTQEMLGVVSGLWNGAVKKYGVTSIGVFFYKYIFEKDPTALQLFPFRNEPNVYES